MLHIYDDLIKYEKWTGNRENFLSVIADIEKVDPDRRMLQSKKSPYPLLPINMRRIQWFASQKIIPEAENRTYSFEHLVYYWLAIKLRKNKLTFDQIEGLADQLTTEQAREDLLNDSLQSKFLNSKSDANKNLFQDEISSHLKKLGRVEGKALRSTLTRIAITPWCHVHLNEKHMKNLSQQDIDVLASVFRKSLSELIE